MNDTDGKISLSSRKLKALRRNFCLSQETLAFKTLEKKLGISIATIKRAESGKKVSYGTAYKLTNFYGVKLADIIEENTEIA